jgi:hypothetical protein
MRQRMATPRHGPIRRGCQCKPWWKPQTSFGLTAPSVEGHWPHRLCSKVLMGGGRAWEQCVGLVQARGRLDLGA